MPDQSSQSQVGQPDVLRRRLAKGGLAAPVVLASLVSKPVLGQTTPWNCTISGQLSGNVSGHGEDPCTTVGDSGTQINDVYPLTASQHTLIQDQFPDMTTDYLFIEPPNTTTLVFSLVTPPPPAKAASINKILNLGTSDSHIIKLRKALVLMINAKNHAPSYPLTVFQAERLYVAVATMSNFVDENPHVEWNQDQITHYIELLYRD